MARLRIDLDLDNAAFEEDRGEEVARILRDLADDIILKGARDGRNLFDLDGNTVGKWSVTARVLHFPSREAKEQAKGA